MTVSNEQHDFSELEERLRSAERPAQHDFQSLRNRVMREVASEKIDASTSRWKQGFGLATAVLLAFVLGRYTSPTETTSAPVVVAPKAPVENPEVEVVQNSAQKTVTKIKEVPSYSEEFVRATDDFWEEINQLRSHRRKILIEIQGRL